MGKDEWVYGVDQDFAVSQPRMVTVPVRGRTIELSTFGDSATLALGLALLALEDPRVDAVFRAFRISFEDEHGRQFWPPKEEG